MSTDMVLCVSDMHKDVQISTLSEDDFEEVCIIVLDGIFCSKIFHFFLFVAYINIFFSSMLYNC